MTGELSKKFHGVGIGPLSKILTVKGRVKYLTENQFQNSVNLAT